MIHDTPPMPNTRASDALTILGQLALWKGLDDKRYALVSAARASGHTWAEIEAASGISRATAKKHFERAGEPMPEAPTRATRRKTRGS